MQLPLKFQWHSSQRWKLNSLSSQGNPEQAWPMLEVSQYPNSKILHNDSNKNSMVLAQKQTWRTELKEQNSEDPDMNPHSYAHLIFEKCPINIWWRNDSLFNKCCSENWIFECRKLKLDPIFHPVQVSKWIKNLNIKSETLKLVQERVQNTLELIGTGNDFISRTTQQLR
jgi:hypothetical protein